ncbi:MAG: DUF1800 domain-containing protein [Alteraurantiacibacter sp.]
MTTPLRIATDRFGLGAVPGEEPPADLRDWLRNQLRRFDPAPAALGNQSERMARIGEVLAARNDVARLRRNGGDREAAQMRNRELGVESREEHWAAIGKRLGHAVATDTPFAERLVHFWSNHFAISIDKVRQHAFAEDFEFSVIRASIMGNFGDLVRAAVLHPAMLQYLDQNISVGPSSNLNATTRREFGFNENLGRELLELHTMGVGSGYTQADVTELALALTGWTVAGMGNSRIAHGAGGTPGEAVFFAQMHEPGTRTVLGRRYAQAGAAQADAIIADIVRHPVTARHIAIKLARHFIADDPPEAAVSRLAAAFTASGGELLPVYDALVELPAVWDAPRDKIRSPWDWLVASLRAAPGGRDLNDRAAQRLLGLLGQPTWQVGSPAGWGDTAYDWAGSGALMTRVEIAAQLSRRLVGESDPRELATEVLGDALRPATRGAISGSGDAAMGFALLIASPEFQRR